VCFFSRRRGDTRLVSEWSSDVCSSDLRPQFHRLQVELLGLLEAAAGFHLLGQRKVEDARLRVVRFDLLLQLLKVLLTLAQVITRSEERRVGKGGKVQGARSELIK